jgi:F-type H+-transporting ATPase subunit epsilon
MQASLTLKISLCCNAYFKCCRQLSTPAAAAEAAPTALVLNFCLPHKPIYTGKQVETVVIPGVAGVYAVTKGHSPIVSELQPGLIAIYHEAGKEPEKWFVSAGFALTHRNSVTDITALEAVQLSDLDPEAVKEVFAQAKADVASASGEKAKAAAQVALSTAKAMADALGLAVVL